jgi:hypothetical protein
MSIHKILKCFSFLFCQGEPREADKRAAEAGGLPGPRQGTEGVSAEGQCPRGGGEGRGLR